jgi:hypothetical protein
MKRAVFFLIILSAVLFVVFYPEKKMDMEPLVVSTPADQYVSLDEDGFIAGSERFIPMVLNYKVSLQTDSSLVWPCPYLGYSKGGVPRFVTRDSSLMELRADLQLIRELGFNSVRIVGIGEHAVDDKSTNALSVNARYRKSHDVLIEFSNDDHYNSYLHAIEDLLRIAKECDLRVIFLTRLFHEVPGTERNLAKIAAHFRNDPTILAYDFFNEPLYFDSIEHSKREVYDIVNEWQSVLKTNAPNHLSTIGLTGIREVFQWDPNILNVDFLSIHPYEYQPEQVRNEMFWYSRFIDKPWIVGETAIPADGDSVPYEDQLIFAEKTIEQTFNCGGLGYSWWQYKDVDWHDFHANFMGVVTRGGSTYSKDSLEMYITVKPVAEAFRNFKLPDGDCLCLDNYYNYSQGDVFELKGRLVDKDGKPIDGGVILAWNEWWTRSYHTVTREDGSFLLKGTFPFYHWIASATRYSVVRGDIDPEDATMSEKGIPQYDLEEIDIKKLNWID